MILTGVALDQQVGRKMVNNKIPIKDKYTLTISEASEYFNIGRDKLYELVKEDGNNYTLHNGKNILIKRQQLERYLENKSYI